MTATKQPGYGRSLAYLQFQARLTTEIRNFWYLNNSTYYATRLINSIPIKDRPESLAKIKGDEKYPFTSLDITLDEFTLVQPDILSALRENTVVTFVTAFEVYLFNSVERTIFLQPSCMEDSKLNFTASELSVFMKKDEPKVEFARSVTDKYIRNKSHADMISRLAKMIKSGVMTSLKAEVEEWNNWSLVRNSIVHAGRGVSHDLFNAWSTKFPSVGEPLSLESRDVVRVHYLALRLAREIDKRFVETIVKFNDAELLARELISSQEILTPSEIASKVSRSLGARFSKSQAEKALAIQRRGEKIIGFRFTPEMLRWVK